MENYRQLALRYLKLNRNRSMITVIGTAITVVVLFTILNLGWCTVLDIRESLREDQDYEVVFLTENKEQIEEIKSDSRIKNASVGSYYYYDFYESKTYDNALYVNFTNPYRMDHTAVELSESMNVGYEHNSELALTYMQGGEDFMGVIVCCFVLLISFVFAIFGVGIVRNSIQLCTLEQIKDYGNLRCIGSTRDQLKSVIYLEGAILETAGIVVGLIVGMLTSFIAGAMLHINVGFHILPVLPVLVAFYGDLYFVMQENCKVVTNMTPVAAIRGEYRIKKEKLRHRYSGLFGKLFGVEGDYAYKNMMRNPGRFRKTTGAIAIGIAACIAAVGIGNTLSYLENSIEDSFGYYHMYMDADYIAPTQTVDAAKSGITVDVLEKMNQLPGIVEAKQVYCAQVLLRDWREVYSHYTDDYFRYVGKGIALDTFGNLYDAESKIEDTEETNKSKYLHNLVGVKVYGYDESDLQRYKDTLVDGTLDVSENGILLMNHCTTTKDDFEDLSTAETIEVDFTDYKVGDTIDIVDTEKFRTLFLERMEPVNEKYKDVYKKFSLIGGNDTGDEVVFENGVEDESSSEEQKALQEQYDAYMKEKADVYAKCYDELVKQGAYKTYTIEGILNGDVNRSSYGGLEIIVPLKQYYAMSGTGEGDSIGMQYHFKNFPVVKYYSVVDGSFGVVGWDVTGEPEGCNTSYYPEFRSMLMEFKVVIVGLILFILFVVLISCINIVNTTASNIYLRRQEFAQLRVIGVSQKGLIKMVLLEGIISSIVANIIGIVIGLAISYGLFRLVVTTIYGYQYQFPWIGILISMVVSTLVLCGSIYLPLKKLNHNMADCLKTGNE